MVEGKTILAGGLLVGALALGFMALSKPQQPPDNSGNNAGSAPYQLDLGSFLGPDTPNPLFSALSQTAAQSAKPATGPASGADVASYLNQYFNQNLFNSSGQPGQIETVQGIPGLNLAASQKAIEAASQFMGFGNFSMASGGVANIPPSLSMNMPAMQAAGVALPPTAQNATPSAVSMPAKSAPVSSSGTSGNSQMFTPATSSQSAKSSGASSPLAPVAYSGGAPYTPVLNYTPAPAINYTPAPLNYSKK